MKLLIILVLMVVVTVSGCRSDFPTINSISRMPVFFPHSSSATSLRRSSKPLQEMAQIEFVAYDQPESMNDGVLTSSSEVHASSQNSMNSAGQMLAISLPELQTLAIENNPTIKALAATTQKAAGYRAQVGLAPNPTIGYQAVQLADQSTDQHTLFFERQFVRGNKLELNKRVLNEAIKAQNFELDAQQIRVLTDVEIKFYDVLAAQRRVELLNEIAVIVDKGLELSETRFRANESSRIDVLQAKIQKNEVDLARKQAEIHLAVTWTELTTISGVPNMARVQVVGDLPADAVSLDWDLVASEIVASSPEMHAALARVEQARETLNRHRVQTVPNVTGQIAAGVDNGTNSGLINLQVSVPLTVNNRNQGNILAAQADYCRAVSEAERVELAIKTRLAAISREYDSSLAAVKQFTQEILPNAVESLELADRAYKAGESSFVQVLVARRTFFDSNINSLEARLNLAQAKAKIEGLTLTGAIDSINDGSGDDALRGLSLDQQ